jgi:hypothetical protein
MDAVHSLIEAGLSLWLDPDARDGDAADDLASWVAERHIGAAPRDRSRMGPLLTGRPGRYDVRTRVPEILRGLGYDHCRGRRRHAARVPMPNDRSRPSRTHLRARDRVQGRERRDSAPRRQA